VAGGGVVVFFADCAGGVGGGGGGRGGGGGDVVGEEVRACGEGHCDGYEEHLSWSLGGWESFGSRVDCGETCEGLEELVWTRGESREELVWARKMIQGWDVFYTHNAKNHCILRVILPMDNIPYNTMVLATPLVALVLNHGTHSAEPSHVHSQRVLLTTYSSLKIHFPPLLCASNQRSCTIAFSCSFARSLSSCCSCVVGKSTRQNPGGVLRRS